MSIPRVSIGIPVYNGQKYLRAAINSVLAQQYENFEIIISDNASTDATEEICRQYAAADARIRYYRNDSNIGAVPNFNRVFILARGELFKWLTYDDICDPRFLSACIDAWNQAPPTVSLVYPRCELIDAEGKILDEIIEDVETRSARPYSRMRKVLLKRTSAQALCGLISSEHLRRTRLRGSFAMDDMALLAELSLIGEFWLVPDVLLQIRVHPDNAATQHRTARSHAVWINPQNQNKFVMPPRARIFLECFRSIAHVPLRPFEKFACFGTVPLVYCEGWARGIAGPIKRRVLRRTVAPSRQGPVNSDGV